MSGASIVINFGVSLWAKWHSPTEERKMSIPLTGEFKQIPERMRERYLEPGDILPLRIKVRSFTDLTMRDEDAEFPAVELRLKRVEDLEYIFLIWISGRKEWVAVYHRSFWPEGSHGADASEEGPFALDQYCRQRLIQAFGLTPKCVDLNAVERLSPDDLRGMGN
ncbi:hypothetical protein HQ544_01700 [Candidatus Falkowbacteria bacterium]|nr:hypothetical protein [Candidatus Falkowbacteria bacterium]